VEIVLVKQTDDRLTDDEAAVVRKFLTGMLSGATDKDTRAWNRYVRALNESSAGECFSLKVQRQRDGKFHRRHMGMISHIFKAQERVEDFEAFRLWLKVGSGFVTWMPGPTGGVFPVPRSINFNTCSEEDMREFHDGVCRFLRTGHAPKYLFPHVDPKIAEEGIDAIITKWCPYD
jgi:hypothetical protein